MVDLVAGIVFKTDEYVCVCVFQIQQVSRLLQPENVLNITHHKFLHHLQIQSCGIGVLQFP